MKTINSELCAKGIEYIDFLENGGNIENNTHFQSVVREVNEAQNALKANLKEKALKLIEAGKIPAVLGGEHSTPLGLIEALDSLGKPFGVLQIDAHADLRDAYEGFEQSHASIMFNVLKNCPNMQRLAQVGIRDIAQSEIELIQNSNGRVKTFFDWDIKDELYRGKNWAYVVERIINHLPEHVYISFDIDGLRPYLCPNTGTRLPVVLNWKTFPFCSLSS